MLYARKPCYAGSHVLLHMLLDTFFIHSSYRLLAKGDDSWVPQHNLLIDHLKKLWTSNDFHARLGKVICILFMFYSALSVL